MVLFQGETAQVLCRNSVWLRFLPGFSKLQQLRPEHPQRVLGPISPRQTENRSHEELQGCFRLRLAEFLAWRRFPAPSWQLSDGPLKCRLNCGLGLLAIGQKPKYGSVLLEPHHCPASGWFGGLTWLLDTKQGLHLLFQPDMFSTPACPAPIS